MGYPPVRAIAIVIALAGCGRSGLLAPGDGPQGDTHDTGSWTSSSTHPTSSSTTSTSSTTTSSSSTTTTGTGGADPGLSGSGCEGPAEWAKQFDNAPVHSVAVDSNGGVAATGKISGMAGADFGGGPLDGSMFAVRFDASGNYLWGRGFGGGLWDSPSRISFGPIDGVVVAGTFTTVLDLESGPLTCAGTTDGFVASFDAWGNSLWAASFGDDSSHAQFGNDAAVDSWGNVALVGSWGHGPPNEASAFYFHVEKRDPEGALLWTGNFGTEPPQEASALGVAFDAAGDMIVSGGSSGNVDFGGGPMSPDYATCVVKLDPDGDYVWSAPVGGVLVAVDAAGNIVVAGVFDEPTDFGGGVITPDPSGDIYVVKLDTNGAHVWSKSFGGVGWEYVDGLAIDTAGNILLTGSFYETFDFGAAPLVHVGTGANVFVAGLDPSGAHLFSLRTGDGDYIQEGTTIAVDTMGNLFVAGQFMGTLDFGGVVLDAGDDQEGFIAKLACGL